MADGAVVLFDGVCNLCNGAVQFIIDRDPQAHFRFAAQQSEPGAALLARVGRPLSGEPDTIVLVEGGRVYERSDAALRIARRLSGAWRLLALLRVVPRPLRDAVYGLVARSRYRVFGRSAECRVPTPELRARFLA